ncbi:MAG: DUF1573 domain-containing protein [Cytophagales bacterium]|nr:DUF1573 domain-containing protein [Cytophagales bacterium]
MTKLFYVSIFLAAFFGANAQSDGPLIVWEKSSHDFGDVTQGDKVEHTFKFRNAGTVPLIITNVQVTCGCTTPKGWARDPIPPGQSSEITVAFNSAGKYGRQEKVVSVVSNAANPEGSQILFSANVLERKAPNE